MILYNQIFVHQEYIMTRNRNKILMIGMMVSLMTPYLSLAKEVANNNGSIYDTSIDWNDDDNKNKLLDNVTKWDDNTIKKMYEVYRHPEDYQLPSTTTELQYNVLFINAHWGPLDNPFNQFTRPTKAYVFFEKTSQDGTTKPVSHYLAPVIKDLADGNYYIYTRYETHPVLLNDWVAGLRNEHTDMKLRFNICNGYANYSDDSCTGKSYTDEIRDTQDFSTRSERLTVRQQAPSAHRDVNADWKSKVNKAKTLANTDSIYDTSISWTKKNKRDELLNTVNNWPNVKIIQDNFEKLRDLRYFQDSTVPNFSRRISWLYPDDGCWTRAAAVIKDLFGPLNNLSINQFNRPSKVFAFGNLCANTPNSTDGKVSWWYHTAPIVKDAETKQTYVLDPSINPRMPLTIEKWVEAISATTGACSRSRSSVEKINICNGYGTSPYNNCNDYYPNETSSMLSQPGYQNIERQRQVELGRDANAVLGDQPPWLNS